MKTITVNLTGYRYLTDIHEKIRVSFGFPQEHGNNWDAFWDFLWSKCDADKVIIFGENSLTADFYDDLLKFHDALNDNIKFRKECGLNPFTYEVVS